jgi:hypothetical protein
LTQRISPEARPRAQILAPPRASKHGRFGAPEEVGFAAQEAKVNVQERVNGVVARRCSSRHLLRHAQKRRVKQLQVRHGEKSTRLGSVRVWQRNQQ